MCVCVVDLRPQVDASGVRASAPLPTLMLLLLVNTLALCCVLLLLLATGCSDCSIVSPLRSRKSSSSCRRRVGKWRRPTASSAPRPSANCPRSSASSRVSASVRPSVCLSVCHTRRRSRCRAVSQLTCAILCRADRAYSNVTDGRCLSVSWSVTAGPAVY